MTNNLNFKSLLIGAVIGAAVVFSIAAATKEGSSCGRYKLTSTEGYIYKIDTTTGQVWRTSSGNPSHEFMAAIVDKE